MREKKKIVHLDDHKLFTTAVWNTIQPNFPDVSYMAFNNTDEAFYYLISNLFNKHRIDLLITDLSHPGLDGYEFSKAIRSFENTSGGPPIPILLLTFHSDNTSPIIKRGLNEKVFDKYLRKDSTSEELIDYIRSVIG